ncbi:MAG: UDP-2,3-diacylglucosamine diphosphatase LpxI [Myxococcota bacterium]|nr:UDP-2,3-diacylglucosamine diphosphatase LpxI [Myxococcota bacterium]
MNQVHSPPPFGLIAGNGSFPLLFAKAAMEKNIAVVAVAMEGETKTAITDHVPDVQWVKVGQLSRMIRFFKKHHVQQAAMAGGVKKTRLFMGARPDWTALKLLAQTALKKDDGMLRAIAAEFEKHGIEIVDSTIFMPEALAPSGLLTNRSPTAQEQKDLDYGLRVAREIGKLDIGQTVVVREGTVVALEAMEGTDACILRAGKIANNTKIVVVKVAKPVQDMRFDIPAIGIQTIEAISKAGGKVLGIEANRTLLLEPEVIIKKANQVGITIIGLD